MSSKNRGFAAGLAGALNDGQSRPEDVTAQPARSGVGILAARGNRISELASGSVVARTHELVDPARCKLWSEHNRDYAQLDENRCADLLDSLKAQGRQEVPAIVRRLRGDADFDFEVICGARRHWAVSWLRRHNYPDFRFLVEPQELTDEQAFRVSDLENRAREDLTDVERARDYLRALDRHYGGSQKAMAERMRVTESWLSRYLDLARLPSEIIGAFPSALDLKIKHVHLIKPLLKPEDRRSRVLAEASRVAQARREGEGATLTPQDVIRRLALAADPPKKSGSPKKTGLEVEVISSVAGSPVLRVQKPSRSELTLTLLLKGGAERADAEAALKEVLDRHWKH
jgi:ParB family chromosome partitioning protein